jgi:hypothetical protein
MLKRVVSIGLQKESSLVCTANAKADSTVGSFAAQVDFHTTGEITLQYAY